MQVYQPFSTHGYGHTNTGSAGDGGVGDAGGFMDWLLLANRKFSGDLSFVSFGPISYLSTRW